MKDTELIHWMHESRAKGFVFGGLGLECISTEYSGYGDASIMLQSLLSDWLRVDAPKNMDFVGCLRDAALHPCPSIMRLNLAWRKGFNEEEVYSDAWRRWEDGEG